MLEVRLKVDIVTLSEKSGHKSEKTISNLLAQWAFSHVFLSIPENPSQKYPKLTSLQHFEVDIPRNFQK